MTDKAEIIKLALTPTEIVEMLSRGQITNIILELKENKLEYGKDKTVDEAKAELGKLVHEDEDVYYFDCDMYKHISGNNEKIVVTELASKIKISFSLPAELRAANRSYRLLTSHSDESTGKLITYENPCGVNSSYEVSFDADKLCLMALTYTDDTIRARKAAEKAAAEKEAAEKEAAAKAAAEKEAAEKAAAKAEEEKVDKAKAEIDKSLADAIKAIDNNKGLDDAAKAEVKKAVETAAAAAKKEIDDKGSAVSASELEKFNNAVKSEVEAGEKATGIRSESTVTAETLEANGLAINEGLKIDQKGSKLSIAWGKVAGAKYYDVYVQYCGKNFAKTPDKTQKSSKTKATITKINGKKLNLKKNYKIYIVAYKLVDGKKVTLGKSITAHVVGRLNTKYSNAKDIEITSKTNLTIKKGKTSTIKAKTILVTPGKKQLSKAHAAEFRYASSDKKVATVDKKGKIKAVGKGSCTIYVYSRNGYTKKISVTVK